MDLRVEHRIGVSVAAVEEALTDPAYYDALAALPGVAPPALLACETGAGATVRVAVRYSYTGDLPPGASSVIDAHRLTWVEHSILDRATHTIDFTIAPDHYASRLAASGRVVLTPDGTATRRVVTATVRVRLPLVGRRVEQVIVDGFRERYDDQVAILEAYVRARTAAEPPVGPAIP